ncbi:MAG: L,D-transpeptidase family protein [Pseudomonadales bacterium]|nr:L,D-transpeptidase family protein [Pseudomonadales bacterium]NIX07083.1 L,D-transpeptidase family protein [Pseudomonadales bacterium]
MRTTPSIPIDILSIRGATRMALLALGPLIVAAPAALADLKIDRLVIEKSQRVLILEHDGSPVRSYAIALGGAPRGHKQREGDLRTPEGQYTIDARNEDSAFHLSLRISYPNEADRERAARDGVDPGGQIMIHGIGEADPEMRKLHPYIDWTAGCVAVTDSEIEEIWSLVEIGTPILIRP